MTTFTISNPFIENFFSESVHPQSINKTAEKLLESQITLLSLQKGVYEAKNDIDCVDLDDFLLSEGL